MTYTWLFLQMNVQRFVKWTQVFCTFIQLSLSVCFLHWPWCFTLTDISRSANVVTVVSKSVFFLLLISKNSSCSLSSGCFQPALGFPLFSWARSYSCVTAVCFKTLFPAGLSALCVCTIKAVCLKCLSSWCTHTASHLHYDNWFKCPLSLIMVAEVKF